MMNRMMKKIAVAIAAATMMITAAGTTAMANDGTGIDSMTGVSCTEYDATMYVAAQNGANVRTAPSSDARLLHTLSYGQKVTVCGKTSNGWYQLLAEDTIYGGQTTGYIAGNLLSDSKPVTEQATGYASGITADGQIKTNNAGTPSYVKTTEKTATKENYTVKVDGYLALRSEPAFNASNEIGQLHTGDTVQFRSNYGTYWCVYVPSTGLVGFVNCNYLE